MINRRVEVIGVTATPYRLFSDEFKIKNICTITPSVDDNTKYVGSADDLNVKIIDWGESKWELKLLFIQ